MIDIQKGQVVAINMRKSCLCLIRLLLHLIGAHKALWNREHCWKWQIKYHLRITSDAQNLVGTIQICGRNQHFCQLWIQGKFGHQRTKLGEFAIVCLNIEL